MSRPVIEGARVPERDRVAEAHSRQLTTDSHYLSGLSGRLPVLAVVCELSAVSRVGERQ